MRPVRLLLKGLFWLLVTIGGLTVMIVGGFLLVAWSWGYFDMPLRMNAEAEAFAERVQAAGDGVALEQVLPGDWVRACAIAEDESVRELLPDISINHDRIERFDDDMPDGNWTLVAVDSEVEVVAQLVFDQQRLYYGGRSLCLDRSAFVDAGMTEGIASKRSTLSFTAR